MSEQPQWPSRGQKAPNYWDDDLKAYIDWLRDSIDDKIVEAIAADETVAAAAAAAVAAVPGNVLLDLADRIDGSTVYNTASGTLLLNPAKAYHVIKEATGPLTIELGTPPGKSLAFKVVTGAENATIDALPDVEVTDDAWVIFVFYDGAWSLVSAGSSGGGGGIVEPVTDPPTQPGAITVSPTADGYNLSWAASAVAAGYEGSIDGSPFVDYGSGLAKSTKAVHGAVSSGSSHSGLIRSYNSLGQKSSIRAWGPSETLLPSLDEQLLAYEPALFLRFSNGFLEDLSFTAAKSDPGWSPTWDGRGKSGVAQTVLPNYSGPPVLEDDEFSVDLVAGSSLYQKVYAPELSNQTKITFILIGKAPFSSWDITGVGRGGGGSAGSFNEAMSFESVHVMAHTIDLTQDPNNHQWRDGVQINVDGAGWTSTQLPNLGGWGEGMYIGGNQYGGTSNGAPTGVLISRAVLIAGEALTGPQLIALAKAAGTFGSPR